MKFGKQFDFYKIPEWSEYYFDYLFLKKLLTQYDKRREAKKALKRIKKLKSEVVDSFTMSRSNEKSGHTEDSDLEDMTIEKDNDSYFLPLVSDDSNATLSEEQKVSYFVNAYKEKIAIVENFYNDKLKEFQQNFKNLQKKISNRRSLIKVEQFKIQTKQENAERDELGYAVSWKRAMSSLYNQTSWLHSYYSINSLAIKKLKKKAKKVFKMHKIDIERKLNEVERSFQVFNSLEDSIKNLVDLRREIKNLYSDELTDGSIKKASLELEQRLGGGGKVKHTRLISFYCGIIVSSVLFYLLLEFIKPSQDIPKDMAPFFPGFNFTLVIIEVFIGVGLNISILRKYRINYLYIFEIDPKLRLGSVEMFQNGLMLLCFWMICFLLNKLTLCYDFFGHQVALFPMIINCFLLCFLFFPFHCSYFHFRRGIVKILVKNFFPIGKNAVRFRDFLFGDILTSLNKPFASLVLSFYLLSCDYCRENNTRKDLDKNVEYNRDSVACLIVLFAPFAIRFFQCINRYYYTKEAWPHLGNTIKYVGGLSNAIFAWYYGRAGKTRTALILHLVAGGVSQSYMLFWDIYMDWNLGRVTSKNFFLRDKIVYPKSMYYSAIVINSFLRFTWLINLIDTSEYMNEEWKNLIFAVLEAYRRIQWCVFRIENENTNNPEKYRAILAIPELPMD